MGTPASTATAAQASGQRREVTSEAVSVEGLIRLDVRVTDATGRAVTSLQGTDFKVLDNGQAQDIIAFRGPNSGLADRDSLTVILLIDTLQLAPDLAAFERKQAARFLRQNAGPLGEPVTIYSLEDSGLFLTANRSTDGEALARAVDSDSKVNGLILAPHADSLIKGVVTDSSYLDFPALTGLRALGTIAAAEAREPGRKVLIWIGPGPCDRTTDTYAPYAEDVINYSSLGESHDGRMRDLFQKIVWFSTLLRQARITLDCILSGELETTTDLSMQLQAGVPSAQQVSWSDLFKGALAVQSGGRVVAASNDLVRQTNDLVGSVRTSYTLTFDPPLAVHEDEYHTLKVKVNQLGLTACTSSGYYDQPFYDDPLDPDLRRVTVAQLEQVLQEAHGGASAARQLSSLALTERLTRAELDSLSRKLHRKTLRESLEMIADESAFLDPPSSEILADPPPEEAEQRRLLAAATDYLTQVIPKLPDFYATRTAAYYREVVTYPGLDSKVIPEPLHAEQRWKETVLYRHGKEIVDQPAGLGNRPVFIQDTPPMPRTAPLYTYGTFGPVLILFQDVLRLPGAVTWKGWEKSANGRVAVFSYRYRGTPAVSLAGCCFPNSDENSRVSISAGSSGEIVIDPASGAILRVQIENDLAGFVPMKRSDLVVGYGPVEINGKTYILPLYSVNIVRARTRVTLPQWNVNFRVWGPYETEMSVFTFDQYHNFRATSRILPGFQPVH